ncbi:MAG: HAD-IA family hydrolase [Candidatus Pacearchaeota archaeon]
MKMIKSIEAVLFDQDGVILDSIESTIMFYKELLSHYKKPIPDDNFLRNLRFSMTENMRRLFPELAHLSDEELVKIDKAYEETEDYKRNREKRIKLVKPYEDVLPCLDSLYKRFKIGLVTDGKSKLKEYNLARYFDVAIDQTLVKIGKPNPESLLKALDILKIKPKNAVYVGDASTDMLAAKNAGTHFIALIRDKLASERLLDSRYNVNSLEQIPQLID